MTPVVDIVLWVVVPYICLAVFVVGHFWRECTRSSTRKRMLVWWRIGPRWTVPGVPGRTVVADAIGAYRKGTCVSGTEELARQDDDPASPGRDNQDRGSELMPRWTFLTNHAHVLLAIAADPLVRMRDVAMRVGVTERAVQMIVADLVTGGYLTRSRVGRRNQYTVNRAGAFRHPAESDHRIGELLELFEHRR
jgi:hypothetical protein